MIKTISKDQFEALEALLNETKFTETAHYPGAPSEEVRLRCEAKVNDFLQFVEPKLRAGVDESTLYKHARALEASFHQEDTEERERVVDYIGDFMRVLDLHEWVEHV